MIHEDSLSCLLELELECNLIRGMGNNASKQNKCASNIELLSSDHMKKVESLYGPIIQIDIHLFKADTDAIHDIATGKEYLISH